MLFGNGAFDVDNDCDSSFMPLHVSSESHWILKRLSVLDDNLPQHGMQTRRMLV